MFVFRGKEAMVTKFGYIELEFAIFVRGYLLVLLDLVHQCCYQY